MTERIPRAAILKELAIIDATLFSLGLDLKDDLTEEDISAGAEPLSAEHIQAELSKARSTILKIALEQFRAELEEWNALISRIE